MRTPLRHLVPVRATTALSVAALALVLGGGCATTPDTDERARRHAAIARWDACVERELVALGEAGGDPARVERRCEGHRRDVLDAFPTHLGARVERLMEARRARLVEARIDAIEARPAPLIDRLIDAVASP